MEFCRMERNRVSGIVIAAVACLVLFASAAAAAQAQPPKQGVQAPPQPQVQPPKQPGAMVPAPPPPPPPGAQAGAPPPPPPPGAQAGVPAPATAPSAAADPAAEADIAGTLEEGKRALAALDLATAQIQFEAAFSKCDQYRVQGRLLARVYMALGALFAGYLQQIPQGTEFMRLALTNDPAALPEREISNDTVIATYNNVRERLGIAAPAQGQAIAGGPQGPGAAAGQGGFWVMKHERVLQAKRMYPLGIYVETNPMVAVKSARLYFRLPSDPTFQVTEMRRNQNMYGMAIGCDAISLLDPEALYYYIEIIGGDGSIIAAAGSLNAPVEIRMVDEASFKGAQPILPGMKEPAKCNPDDAAPCPPWDPHCHDTPCDVDEDCVGDQMCRGGYCAAGDGDGEEKVLKAIGLQLTLGLGMGAGIVGGGDVSVNDGGDTCSPPGVEDCSNPISLGSGLSPSWMFIRLGLGWLFLERFELGAWARLQNISSDSMKVAGMGSVEDQPPMWGLYGTFYYFGDGRIMGPGQIVAKDGRLADKQGLRLYAKLEFNFFGTVYHSVKVNWTDSEDVDRSTSIQRASGMQALGIGPGILYGVHRFIDIGGELMYDYVGLGTDTWAHTFDLWFFVRAHI